MRYDINNPDRYYRHWVHHVLRVVVIYYPQNVPAGCLRGGWHPQGGQGRGPRHPQSKRGPAHLALPVFSPFSRARAARKRMGKPRPQMLYVPHIRKLRGLGRKRG